MVDVPLKKHVNGLFIYILLATTPQLLALHAGILDADADNERISKWQTAIMPHILVDVVDLVL